MNSIWYLIKTTGMDWWEDNAPRLGAALAFYTMLSLAPLLLIIISIAGLFWGEDAARGQLLTQASELVGEQGEAAIETMIANSQDTETGTLSAILGFLTLLIGATGLFGQLQDALNTIWEVQPKSGRGIWGMLRDRFLSFAMVLGICFLLLVSLVVSAALAAVNTFFEERLPDMAPIALQAGHLLLSLIVFTLLFAMMFKLLPDVEMAWSDVWIGAFITSVLFIIGKFAIGLYVGASGFSSTYGAAGSLVVLLVWVYYSAQILFLGAEFTQVYANKFGSKTAPAENAVRVTDESRAQQGIPRQHAT